MINHQVRRILVPVDFTENTDLAISKALQFCQEEDSSIYLFHVQRKVPGGVRHFLSKIISGYSLQQVYSDTAKYARRLEELKTGICAERKDIRVYCAISVGNPVQEIISLKARQISADLIIVGKHSHHSLLPFLNTVIPSKLAATSGMPVLTAKPGSLNQEVRTIVIPVGPKFPVTKLEMFSAFKSSTRPRIKLVIFNEEGMDMNQSRQLLLNTFRVLKSQFLNIVSYEVLEGTNKAKALLKYCNEIGADVLIVDAGSETRIGVWTNSHISDLLPSGSKTQVLAISQ